MVSDRAFEVIDIIKDYEQSTWRSSSDLSSPEAVVNMYAYIVGELSCLTGLKNWTGAA